MVDYCGYLYATAVATGGFASFAASGCLNTLAVSLLFASFLAYGAQNLSDDKNDYTVTVAANCVYTGIITYRLITSGQIFPAGLLCILSFMLMMKLRIQRLRYWKQK